jgi:hypothetical protein
MVQKAIKYTAKMLDGYSHVDQGNGLVKIPAAFEYLKILSERKEYEKVLIYDVETTNTFFPDKVGPAAFWKSNGYFPIDQKQTVKVKAVFSDKMAESDKHNFYRGFKLRSNADWLKTDRSEIYIRGELGTDFGLIYDENKLNKPGLYSAKIFAYPKNEPGENADFDVQATIVIPYNFHQGNKYKQEFKNINLKKGDINRYYIETPAGASSMRITLSPVEEKNFGMAMYLFSPDGNNQMYKSSADANNNKPIEFVVTGEQMQRGIWEVLPYCYYQSSSDSYYNLEITFYGIKGEKEIITDIEIPAGEEPKASTKIINEYYQPVSAKFKGNIFGYQKTDQYSQTNKTTFTESIKIGKDVGKIDFFIDLTAEEYNKVTDLAVNIYDESGKAVYSNGMSRKYLDFTFTPKKPGNYKLELVPAFTSAAIKAQEWKFNIRERYYYKQPISLNFKKDNMIFYPGTWYDIDFNVAGNIPMSPDGFKTFGFINIIDSNTDSEVFRQLIEM